MFSEEIIEYGLQVPPRDLTLSPARRVPSGRLQTSIRDECLDWNRKWSSSVPPRSQDGAAVAAAAVSSNDIDRATYRSDGFYPEEQQNETTFAWTEDDGNNIAALISEPGFGTTGQLGFGKELDAQIKQEFKVEEDASQMPEYQAASSSTPPFLDAQPVSSTSASMPNQLLTRSTNTCMVDKSDPRSRFHFVKHVKRHGRTIKLWECGICSREFQHQYTLMRHLPTHTDERNFHCNECGKAFRQLSTLSQHRAIHSASRPYTCEVCSKTFNRVSTLISHRKTHSEDKPYKCHICPKGFHQKGNLRNHLFTHTNERPYICSICNQGFNQQSNLVCHKNKVHSENGRGNMVPPRSSRISPNIMPLRNRRYSPRPPPVTRSQSAEPILRRSNPEHMMPNPTRQIFEQCEVTSSVQSSSWPPITSSIMSQEYPEDHMPWSFFDPAFKAGGGVIVDPINTYHMGVALAMKKIPFALLKPDQGTPILVKVVDTKLLGGKQMLVPATVEDLRNGGRIETNKLSEGPFTSTSYTYEPYGIPPTSNGAVQIRVPVVATLVPRLIPGGRLQVDVQEPDTATAVLSTDFVGEVRVVPCGVLQEDGATEMVSSCCLLRDGDRQFSQRGEDPVLGHLQSKRDVANFKTVHCSSVMPPPAPSPPCRGLDLFEPMECIPMGPQITAVENADLAPRSSDDSDIFIGEFENHNAFSIQLSDSD